MDHFWDRLRAKVERGSRFSTESIVDCVVWSKWRVVLRQA